jgi:hypothetical protein
MVPLYVVKGFGNMPSGILHYWSIYMNFNKQCSKVNTLHILIQMWHKQNKVKNYVWADIWAWMLIKVSKAPECYFIPFSSYKFLNISFYFVNIIWCKFCIAVIKLFKKGLVIYHVHIGRAEFSWMDAIQLQPAGGSKRSKVLSKKSFLAQIGPQVCLKIAFILTSHDAIILTSNWLDLLNRENWSHCKIFLGSLCKNS